MITLVPNIYFELTEAFNRGGPIVALASGQAVVFYRIAIMSKDGDWIIRETPDACERVLAELDRHGARCRPGAPLDVRWLAGGWSSHFEFSDRGRRIRCDFISRPPRVDLAVVHARFQGAPPDSRLLAIDPESLLLMKQTQRAKDYVVIAELARRLPPEREIALTTDPDRILELASTAGASSTRPAVVAARTGQGRRAVVLALAAETDDLQQADRRRLLRYTTAARPYLDAWAESRIGELPLPDGHRRSLELAERWLPRTLQEDDRAGAE